MAGAWRPESANAVMVVRGNTKICFLWMLSEVCRMSPFLDMKMNLYRSFRQYGRVLTGHEPGRMLRSYACREVRDGNRSEHEPDRPVM